MYHLSYTWDFSSGIYCVLLEQVNSLLFPFSFWQMKDFDPMGLRTEIVLGSRSVINSNRFGVTESVNSVVIVENVDV